MNWRAAFLRAWVLVSVIWVIGWSVVVLPDAEKKLRIARMSDAELMSQIDECQLPPGVPPPLGNLVLDECLKRLNLARGSFEHWGGGDDYTEQAVRVARAFLLELAFLFGPPLFIVVRGYCWTALGWFYKDQITVPLRSLVTAINRIRS
jgi:hypothetical protein